jgi:hypothetical protein
MKKGVFFREKIHLIRSSELEAIFLLQKNNTVQKKKTQTF